nr:outer membrane protein assembly factor BamD [Gammaproteobacteria bacterium]
MKKLLILLLVSLLLTACATAEKDPFKNFEHNTSQQIFNRGEFELAKEDYAQAIKAFEALD